MKIIIIILKFFILFWIQYEKKSERGKNLDFDQIYKKF